LHGGGDSFYFLKFPWDVIFVYFFPGRQGTAVVIIHIYDL